MGGDQVALTTPAPRLRRRRIAFGVAVVAALACAFFGLLSERSYRLLRSAQEAGAPSTSAIRAWMTLDYVANAYGVPVATLAQRLAIPEAVSPQGTIKSIAIEKGVAPFAFVQQVQTAIASSAPAAKPAAPGWFASIADSALSVVLAFGYAGYATVRFFGSFGAPLPDGVATILAGSLSAQGRFGFWPSVALGSLSATLGDLAGYFVGVWLGSGLIARHGPSIGMTAARQAFVHAALDRWGTWTVLVTRTLAASLGALVNLASGATGYSVVRFMAASLAGRLVWTLASVWLGYSIGADVEAASVFLRNFAGLLLSVLALATASTVWLKASAPKSVSP